MFACVTRNKKLKETKTLLVLTAHLYHGRLDGWFLSEQKCFAIIFYPSFHIKTKSKNKRPGRTLYCTVNPPLYCTYQKMRYKKLFVGYQFVGYQFVDCGYQFVGYQFVENWSGYQFCGYQFVSYQFVGYQ